MYCCKEGAPGHNWKGTYYYEDGTRNPPLYPKVGDSHLMKCDERSVYREDKKITDRYVVSKNTLGQILIEDNLYNSLGVISSDESSTH